MRGNGEGPVAGTPAHAPEQPAVATRPRAGGNGPTPRPRTVEEARRQIEDTRSQISRTLESIEDELEAKKQQIRAKLDVPGMLRARVRERPWLALGIALAAGALISGVFGSRGRGLARRDRALLRRWLEAQVDEPD